MLYSSSSLPLRYEKFHFFVFYFYFFIAAQNRIKKKKTFMAYLYDFEQISGDYSCAFGSVGGVLEFWNGNQLRFVCALLCKLKPSVCC